MRMSADLRAERRLEIRYDEAGATTIGAAPLSARDCGAASGAMLARNVTRLKSSR